MSWQARCIDVMCRPLVQPVMRAQWKGPSGSRDCGSQFLRTGSEDWMGRKIRWGEQGMKEKRVGGEEAYERTLSSWGPKQQEREANRRTIFCGAALWTERRASFRPKLVRE